VQHAPRNAELKRRYAGALLNAGGQESVTKARDVLNDAVNAGATDPRVMFLLSQAQRRLGDSAAAEATARRMIAQNARGAMGYYALAVTLEERHEYQQVVDVLVPAISEFRARAGSGPSTEIAPLLPHLGFAYQQLGDYEKAIAAFDEAHRLSPKDAAVAAYLIQAHLSAKKYATAVDLARKAAADNPDDLRFARLEAQALRQNGKPDEAIALLQQTVKKQSDEPASYVALAQLYSDTHHGSDAIRILQEAETKFPDEPSIAFELGAAFEKQKRYADAESAFRQVLAKEPDNAPALNYLGYMLADRGERLDESIGYLKKALEIEPGNGSYLDSLGWAYYKSDQLDLAVDNLRKAAEQLKTNSVIQDHYGDALFKLGRYDDAVAAWDRALAGDGDSIERSAIDKKIRSARQKLGRK
jgi:tetratricopeptide (TPR) repeat protein